MAFFDYRRLVIENTKAVLAFLIHRGRSIENSMAGLVEPLRIGLSDFSTRELRQFAVNMVENMKIHNPGLKGPMCSCKSCISFMKLAALHMLRCKKGARCVLPACWMFKNTPVLPAFILRIKMMESEDETKQEPTNS